MPNHDLLVKCEHQEKLTLEDRHRVKIEIERLENRITRLHAVLRQKGR